MAPWRRSGIVLVGLATVVLVAGSGPGTGSVSGASPAGTLPALPKGNGLIAFTSTRTGNREIFTMNPDGSAQTDVTNDPGSDSQPAWSPDGTRIAFTSNRTGNDEIFTMNADGTSQTDVSNNTAADSQPAWSPDGTRIAFISSKSGNNEVFVMNADGSGRKNLTRNPASDTDPAWSPDGTQIAFTSNRTGNAEVFVMDTGGGGPTDLTDDPSSDSQPAWSPDGSRIAFTSTRTGNSEVFVMDANGLDQQALTDDPASDVEPTFSPDQGTRVAFTSKRDGNAEIYLMDSLDGSDPLDIAHDGGKDSGADWQPLAAGPPNGSPIEHVVILDMENHTFDNVLGKLCAQTGRCDGATTGQLLDGTVIDLARATDIVPVVNHEPMSQRTAVNHGLMNGWQLIQGCGEGTGYACYSQFDQDQIPNLWALAESFALSDRTFQQDVVATWGSHLELVTSDLDGFGRTGAFGMNGPGWGCDSKDDAEWKPTQWEQPVDQPSCIPQIDGSGPYRPSPVPWVSTIMDRMDQNGLSWRLYGGVPFEYGLGYHLSICPTFAECLYGPQNVNFVPRDEFLADAAAGELPNLSIITPGEVDSQHNNDSMLQGDNWIQQQVDAVMQGPQWGSTAIFITYDDCGCFYDHVPPPTDLGLRIPMVIVSPYAKAGFTDSNVASFPSLLAFVEHTFGLAPLTSEDAAAYDYADSFDYGQRPLPPIELTPHAVPAWEIAWIRAHPSDPNDTT